MEEHELSPIQPEDHKKSGLVERSKELIDSAVSSLKGKDMNALVEEYTQEVTLVLEGISSDLTELSEKEKLNAANQTILEENVRSNARETADKLNALQKRVEALEKKTETKRQKGTVTGALKQVTWIAAILASAWVITALLRTFGG